jgi:hypothetical protein
LFYMYHTQKNTNSQEVADKVTNRCNSFLKPLLKQLDQILDLRLVRTLANTVTSIVRHRGRTTALLLSELGAYLTSPEQAPAGTKRLANLIHNPRWQASNIDAYLLEKARQRVVQELRPSQRKYVLCILDASELEKPESTRWEGLAPVISSKARRLSRPRPKMGPGYYRGPPAGPIVVPGLDWEGVLIARWGPVYERSPLTLGAWSWDSKYHQIAPLNSADSPYLKKVESRLKLLNRVVETCGADKLLHVWDRGMANGPWLGRVLDKGWHFVVRWKKGNKLRPATALSIGNPDASKTAQEKDGMVAWRLTMRKRPWGHRRIVNPRNPKQFINVYYGAVPVCLLHRDRPLWLVWARIGKESKLRRGVKEPWRLLTSEPVTSEEECWQIVEAYAGRWQIEQMLRYGKSELGIESIRVKDWESRNKLLAIVGLTYAFLIDLLADSTGSLLQQVLAWAHRTGRQAKSAWRPVYRLRLALSALWQRYTPNFQDFP